MIYKDYGPAILREDVAAFFAERMLRRLSKARQGDSGSESCLIDRLCSVRASAPHMRDLPTCLQAAVKEAVQFLQSVGRKVDLGSPDPALWVSSRGGAPRDSVFTIERKSPMSIGEAFRQIADGICRQARQ